MAGTHNLASRRSRDILRACCLCWGLFLVFGCAASTSRAKDRSVRQIDFELPDIRGNLVSVHDLKGQVVLIDVWATWCKPCLVSFPVYAELYQKYRDRGFGVYAVSVDEDVQSVRSFVHDRTIPFTVLHDPAGELPATMGVSTMPTAFLLDASGQVVFFHEGFSSGDEVILETEIRNALDRG